MVNVLAISMVLNEKRRRGHIAVLKIDRTNCELPVGVLVKHPSQLGDGHHAQG